MSKKAIVKEILLCVLFTVIFLGWLTVATLICYPKWSPVDEKNPSSGIYLEEKNSIDVLLLGSCNMYTSFHPVIFYENTGVTSYDRTCPDQLMSTSYYYLEEALKRQKPKVVVVEALFLTDENTSKREHYDREAIDFMRPSLTKLKLINALVNEEVPYMNKVDPTSPGKLLTYAGYVFPLLRYHSRDDIKKNDFKFFLTYKGYSYTRGSVPFYNYTTMDGLVFDKVNNGKEIREDAKVYVPKIIELCKKNGIDLLFMKSPNNYRWDEETTKIARDYIESLGATFVDISDGNFGTYEEYHYQRNTGRLNIYGMKQLTEYFGKYLVDTYNLTPTTISDAAKEKWEAGVAKMYERSRANGMSIEDGTIIQSKNEDDYIMVRWNSCDDCDKYDVYRKLYDQDESESKKIATVNGSAYNDYDVTIGERYRYRIVPTEGEKKGVLSNDTNPVCLKKPKNVKITRESGKIIITWDASDSCSFYNIQKRMFGGYMFKDFVKVEGENKIIDEDVKDDLSYIYRIRGGVNCDEYTYYSDAEIVRAEPIE